MLMFLCTVQHVWFANWPFPDCIERAERFCWRSAHFHRRWVFLHPSMWRSKSCPGNYLLLVLIVLTAWRERDLQESKDGSSSSTGRKFAMGQLVTRLHVSCESPSPPCQCLYTAGCPHPRVDCSWFDPWELQKTRPKVQTNPGPV